MYHDEQIPQWCFDLSQGMDPKFKEDFKTEAALAGKALGISSSIPLLDAWLYCLFQYLRNNGGMVLATDKGGTVKKVCVESARYCAVLEREALENAAKRSHHTSQAPPPISPLRGGYRRLTPKPAEVPHDFPLDYPSSLKIRTGIIIAEAVKEFPDRRHLEQLCRSIVSRTAPLFCEAVRGGALRGDLAPVRLDDLLHLVLVANCENGDERFAIKTEVINSVEWVEVLRQLAECESTASTPKATGDHIAKNRVREKRRPTRKTERMAAARPPIEAIWRENQNATHKDVHAIADKMKIPTPWQKLPTWSEAHAQSPGKVAVFLSKARRQASQPTK